jgi:hypothetical protein
METKQVNEMEYTAIITDNLSHLIELVNYSFSEGWKPLGGVAVTVQDTTQYFVQAMIRG